MKFSRPNRWRYLANSYSSLSASSSKMTKPELVNATWSLHLCLSAVAAPRGVIIMNNDLGGPVRGRLNSQVCKGAQSIWRQRLFYSVPFQIHFFHIGGWPTELFYSVGLGLHRQSQLDDLHCRPKMTDFRHTDRAPIHLQSFKKRVCRPIMACRSWRRGFSTND